MAFMLDDLEARLGPQDFASGGGLDVRFRQPVFAGDRVEVVGDPPRSDVPLVYEVRVGDRVCATATVKPPEGRR